jgi:hypothetical protein
MKAFSLFISKAGTCAVLIEILLVVTFVFDFYQSGCQPLRDSDEEAGRWIV